MLYRSGIDQIIDGDRICYTEVAGLPTAVGGGGGNNSRPRQGRRFGAKDSHGRGGRALAGSLHTIGYNSMMEHILHNISSLLFILMVYPVVHLMFRSAKLYAVDTSPKHHY